MIPKLHSHPPAPKPHQAGQALVTLLVFVAIGLVIMTAAITISFSTGLATTSFNQATSTQTTAEAGVETAMIKLLRNPAYTGETMTIDGKTVTISVVTTASTSAITVNSTQGTHLKKILATGTWINNALQITAWQELP